MPNDQKPIFVDTQFSQDHDFILRHSPDILLDLGVLCHILAGRNWRGPYEGWTDFPIRFMALKSKFGTKRVKDSLDRLEAYGIIHGMNTNGKKGRLALNYRYDRRNTPTLEPVPSVESITAVEQPKFKSKPQVEKTLEGLGIKVMGFAGWMQQPEIRTVPASHAVRFNRCEVCGLYIDSGNMGASPESKVCIRCWMLKNMKEALRTKRDVWSMDTPRGRKEYNYTQMAEFIKTWEV